MTDEHPEQSVNEAPAEADLEAPVATLSESDIPEDLYKVRLENFYGPLDLLLHLVREHELEISTISISTVAEQYIAFIEALKDLDLDIAGEFLFTASTLMVIKSRNLLPPEVDEDEDDFGEEIEEDPGFELIQRLLEYKQYKDRSILMAELSKIRAKRFSRPRIRFDEALDDEDDDLVQLDIWEIVSHWARISSEIQHQDRTTILYTDIPIETFMESILSRITSGERVSFKALLKGSRDRGVVIGNFLAILELGKQRQITLAQSDDGGDILLGEPDAEQRRQSAEAMAMAEEAAAESMTSPESETPPDPDPEAPLDQEHHEQ
jgi:segregation and condensation protein A